MKKKSVLVFVLGVVCGIIVTLGAIFCFAKVSQIVPKMTLFEEGEHGEVFYAQYLKVIQVLEPNTALAFARTDSDIFGTLVLYVGNENDHFYDEQAIKVPNGKKLIQIGTYQYETTEKLRKTVPVVRIK